MFFESRVTELGLSTLKHLSQFSHVLFVRSFMEQALRLDRPAFATPSYFGGLV